MPPYGSGLRRYRWWFAFAMAALTLFTVLDAIGSRSRKQHVIAAARLQGAGVTTEFAGPAWLGSMLDYVPSFKPIFETRVSLIYYGSREGNVAPIDLGYLVDAPELRRLLLDFGDVTDSDLEIVGKQERLKILTLCSSKITNKGLHQLSSLRQLENLWIIGSEFDDEGLHCLSGMPKLQCLWIRESSGFTGEGLKYLPKECRLKQLNLAGTSINRGLDRIDLGALEDFSARVTRLNDAGLAPLQKAVALKDLCLNDTQVTDQGLLQLNQLKQLRWVSVVGTRVSKPGAEQLIAQLPDVSVAVGPDHKHWEWICGPGALSELAKTAGQSKKPK